MHIATDKQLAAQKDNAKNELICLIRRRRYIIKIKCSRTSVKAGVLTWLQRHNSRAKCLNRKIAMFRRGAGYCGPSAALTASPEQYYNWMSWNDTIHTPLVTQFVSFFPCLFYGAMDAWQIYWISTTVIVPRLFSKAKSIHFWRSHALRNTIFQNRRSLTLLYLSDARKYQQNNTLEAVYFHERLDFMYLLRREAIKRFGRFM